MKKKFVLMIAVIASLAINLVSCSEEEQGYLLAKNDITVEEPQEGFVVEKDQLINIKVKSISDENVTYEWFLNDKSIAKTKDLYFMCKENIGTSDLKLVVTQFNKSFEYHFVLKIKYPDPEEPSGDNKPYITRVLDFRPAPGQFTNNLPKYDEGDTQEDMNQKVLETIGNGKSGLVSLGGYGGYVVVGFDHTIINKADKRDFKILGNAFYAASNPRPNAPLGGSCEPGIVMVAYDANKNNKPDDDEWYELAGSEYHKESTIKGYEITYYRNQPNHEPTVPTDGSESWMADSKNCRWTDNQESEGYIYKNTFHPQEYYPQWIEEDELTFKGTLLPQNGINENPDGQYWVLYAYDWGYVDNRLNREEGVNFDIAWAVNSNGESVDLPGVDFIKVYTGTNQYCGWLGEVSTEVSSILDLHLIEKE